MSKQTMSLSASLPLCKEIWERVGEAPAAYDYVIVRYAGSASEMKPKSPMSAACDRAGQPRRFPSLTAALQASASILAMDGFKRQKGVAQGAMSEAGQWGVWTISGDVVEGKFRPNPKGKSFGIQTVFPVAKQSAAQGASQETASPKKKPVAPVEAAASPVQSEKPASSKKAQAAKGDKPSAPVEEKLPEGIEREGEKFRVGQLLLPSLSMAKKALAAQSAKAQAEPVSAAHDMSKSEAERVAAAEFALRVTSSANSQGEVKPEEIQVSE